jgi:hypothetical protein
MIVMTQQPAYNADVETDSNNWKVLRGLAEIHMLDNQLSALTKKQIKLRLNNTAPAIIGSGDNENFNENEDDDIGGEAGKK